MLSSKPFARSSPFASEHDAEPPERARALKSRSVHLTRFFIAAVALVLALAACAPRDGDQIGGAPIFNGTTPDGQVVEPPITTLPPPNIDAIRVPVDFATIQEAVNTAQPGDLVLIDPGVYFEQVDIVTPDIVIRGRDRNAVFVDGIHETTTGFTVRADGVAIENLTVRNYVDHSISVIDDGNGVPRNGFRALHVTSSNSGGSGIHVRNGQNIEIRQGWFSGHGDAGVSITDCTQCTTLITTSLAEFNARGFVVSGANDGVSIFASTSRNNRAGIVVEDSATTITTGAVVAGSLVQNNGFAQSPSNDDLWDNLYGVGVSVGGTLNSNVIANRVEGNLRAGVLLSPNVEQTSNDPVATRVERNAASNHPEGDIVLALEGGAIDPSLCVAENVAAVIAPDGAAEAAACTDANTAPPALAWAGETRTSIPHQNVAIPPVIDGMTDADIAVPIPAGPVTLPDPNSAAVPDA